MSPYTENLVSKTRFSAVMHLIILSLFCLIFAYHSRALRSIKQLIFNNRLIFFLYLST